ncbi:tyrosine-type recombinase/integrase [Acinetobacter guerrae]|uniref:tyrosine-type recombinase/integrase n=1 Tax=Acinetobacter guerrae TaxID=1843371 RepID=UPI00128C055F|nr:site-specific integrase [Acinetobacter guerrae]MPW45786.1 integrase [Acinetobacter guerrae]
MDIQEIVNFYCKNGLYNSKHTYLEKLKHLEWFYDHDEITINHITDYCTFRKLQGVKNTTINRELNLIRSAFNYYLKYNQTANFKNPFNRFKLFEADFIPRFLTSVECRMLLTATRDNVMLYDFITLALNTGCRASELTTLTWSNVSLEHRYLIIRNSLSKNKKTVYKPLNTVCIAALLRLRSHKHYVFYNPKTDKNIRSFRRGFELAVKRANLGYVRIHDLRHTFASFLVKNGVPLYHVSTLLGHSDIRITQRYAHLAPEHLHDVLKKLPILQ